MGVPPNFYLRGNEEQPAHPSPDVWRSVACVWVRILETRLKVQLKALRYVSLMALQAHFILPCVAKQSPTSVSPLPPRHASSASEVGRYALLPGKDGVAW